MSIFIGFLTVVLVLDCLFIILLVLIQLPKKEAGMGTAFGGGATDALFGAGTGTALTKLTKYGAGIFFLIALTLTVLNNHRARQSGILIEKAMQKAATATPEVTPQAAAVPAINTNALKTLSATKTNAEANVATNKTEVQPVQPPPKTPVAAPANPTPAAPGTPPK